MDKTSFLSLTLFFMLLLWMPSDSVMLSCSSGFSSPSPFDFEDVNLVSVAYNPSTVSYPPGNMSPYGPESSPVYNLTKEALVYLNPENSGNPLSNIVMTGDVVVLKPNFVSPSGFAKEGCTRTSVIRPLVDFAAIAGASKIVIAEGPSRPDPENTVFGSEYSNVTGLVQVLQELYPSVNITYVNLNQDQFTWVNLGENSTFHGAYAADQLYSLRNITMDKDSYYYAIDSRGYDPRGYHPGLYAIANTIFEADVFINVPKMKVHHITGVTLSLKNLIGITVSSTGNNTNEEDIKDIPHWNNTAAHPENLTRQDSLENDVVWRVMADLNKIVFYADRNGTLRATRQRRYLSVADGIIGMEGPSIYNPPGVPRPTGVIIAGSDPIAVDTVCTRIMGFNHTVTRSLTNMVKVTDHTFGTTDPNKICVLGASITQETFGESYVPHVNYEDATISPLKIRLQDFNPPEAVAIKTIPKTPWENIMTTVIVWPQNISRVAAAWLQYSVNDTTPQIARMVPEGVAYRSNLSLMDGGARVEYKVCLMDRFFNLIWSETTIVFVGFREVFSVYWDEIEYQVITVSNSTISGFNFSQAESQISFNGTGFSSNIHFCNVTIPMELLDGDFLIVIDDQPNPEIIVSQNATHSSLYFTYNREARTVKIVGSTVIPEFDQWAILVLLVLAVSAVLLNQKHK